MNIRKISQMEVVIDIRQQYSVDTKNAIEFVQKLFNEDDLLSVKHINLELLSSKNKIEFFDRIAAHKFQYWRLKTITGITVKQGIVDEEDDDEMLVEEGNDDSTLSGISQAVLNGSGLRANEFVQESIKKGYYISAMRYRYESVKDATEFAVILCFKGQNLRVDIDKTYFEDEGKIYVQPLIRSKQNEIIISFQNVAYKVFNELLKKQ